MEIKEHIFTENNRSCVDFYNHVLGNETYDYDSQNITYRNFRDLLNQHFPNNSLNFEFMLNYFLNNGVLIGFVPLSINGECSRWSAIGVSSGNTFVCNDFYDWKDARDKSIHYGFELLNKILLSTKRESK